jgi:hypothetical protein
MRTRSPRTVQQMQPLLISTSFSSVRDSAAPASGLFSNGTAVHSVMT